MASEENQNGQALERRLARGATAPPPRDGATAGPTPASLEWAEIFSTTPLALAIHDAAAEQIRYATPAYAALHGYSPGELVGRQVVEMYAPDSRPDFRERLQRAVGARAVTFHASHLRKDGSTFPARVDARAMIDGDGAVRHWVVTIDDLTRAEAIAEAQAHLAAIVESSDDAIVSKTLEGIITSWNAGAERLFGHTPAEIVGKSILTIVPEELHCEEPSILERIGRGERITPFHTIRCHRDGTRIHVSLSISPIRDLSGRVIGASKILRDITAQRESDAAQAFLATASTRLSTSLDAEATLLELANLAIESMADGCMVTLLDEAAQARGEFPYRHVKVASRVPGRAETVLEMERRFPLAMDAPSGYPHAIRTGMSELIPADAFDERILPAVARNADHLALLQQLEMHSGLVVPLTVRGRTIGALTLIRHGPGGRPAFTERDLRIAEEIGRRAGVALDNARLFADARSARSEAEIARVTAEAAARRASVLQRLTASLSLALTRDDIARVVLDEAMPAFDAHATWIALSSAGTTQLTLLGMRGRHDASMGDLGRDHSAERLSADVVRSGTPRFVLVGSREEWSSAYPGDASFVLGHEFGMLASVPLIFDGRTGGALTFALARREIADEEREGMLAFAAQCAQALERARLLEATRQAHHRAERLQALTAALAAALTPEEVSRISLQEGMRVMGAQAGGVVLLTPDGEHQDLVALGGMDETAIAERSWWRFRVSDPYPVNDVVRDRDVLFMEDIEEFEARYPQVAPTVREQGYQAYAAAPLEAEGRVLGAINYNFLEARSFGAEDITLMRLVAQLCAQALERSRLFASEREARAAAEEANRAKSDFLATMSHELRTPLNAIAGHVQLLDMGLHGPVNDAQQAALARVARAQDRLLTLINDVLNLARVESGRVEYELRPTPIGEVVHEVASLLMPQVDARSLTLDVRMEQAPGEAPIAVLADREKLGQVLLNLLSNAIKFTPAGGRILIDLGEDLPDRQNVVLRVADTGMGIPPDKAHVIFEPFVQLGRGLTASMDGTGLGLAISRDLARGMGGDLTVKSEVGVGSVFSVTLQRA